MGHATVSGGRSEMIEQMFDSEQDDRYLIDACRRNRIGELRV
jgi:hypothetical protein